MYVCLSMCVCVYEFQGMHGFEMTILKLATYAWANTEVIRTCTHTYIHHTYIRIRSHTSLIRTDGPNNWNLQVNSKKYFVTGRILDLYVANAYHTYIHTYINTKVHIYIHTYIYSA